ncbi:DNA-binding response regulator [Mameliella alba]|uniref:LuxR family transcriptional regulator n=2 Tax=Roseobacteraceae TaxID=2854170 RepID=A0A0B3RPJ2_9RHOB|nr:LuxR family transcriptional regulator [Mameliella alba]PTR40683.1 LuxR family two component transcriptional regulator [Mameliella alba]BBU57739.1 DNA-binding response regulator [Mameliella alba]GGF45334.1 DNA-binding response regulator [Mameliella alba]SDC68588.1 two-component system, NarL family, nitrate/nitrite response regulator NarP [Mameliella alba]
MQRERIDIMLGDGNPLVLSAMSEVFERDPRFSLVATSATAEGFLGMIMRVPVKVCVIDWNIPALGAEKLIEVLRAQENAPRIVVYGHDTDAAVPRQAMASGAAAFVSRAAPTDALVQTCLDVAAGKMVFPYLDIRELKTDPISTLSRKERAILDALAEGLTNKQLAARLEISTNTVKFHLSNIFDKLSVKNRAQAIAHFYASKAKSGG